MRAPRSPPPPGFRPTPPPTPVSLGQLRGPLVQFDVIGQQPRAFHAHALQFALELFAPRDHLLDLRLDSARRGLLRAQPLFQTGQFCSYVRVFLADRVRARLQTLVFAAGHFQSLFLIEAFLLALRHGRLALLALLRGNAGLLW